MLIAECYLCRTGRPVIYGTEETNNSPVKVAVFDHFTDFNDLTLCLGKELRQLFPGIRGHRIFLWTSPDNH